MKFKKIVPVALALSIATTVSAGAARLPASAFRPAYSRPSYSTTVSTSQSDFASQVVSLVNAERAKHGLSALTVSTGVQQAAQTRAGELSRSFSHTRPNGASCFTALTEAGVRYARAGENIAYGQTSPAAVMQSWLNSAGHRANILNANFTTIGIGYTVVGGTPYWTQFFTM